MDVNDIIYYSLIWWVFVW